MTTRYYKSYYLPGPPTKCRDGRPAPKCNYSAPRGARVDIDACKCVPRCREGLYYYNGNGKCLTKTEYDREIKEGQDYAKYITDCQNRGGYVMNGKCIVSSPDFLVPNLENMSPAVWVIGGAVLLVLVFLLGKAMK